MDLSPRQRAGLLDKARAVIRRALGGFGRPCGVVDPAASAPTRPDSELHQPAGCFVTLHTLRGELRGCVGRLETNLPLVEAVRTTALGVLDDPRFANRRVRLNELPELELEISVLSPLKPVADALDFKPAEHGIYLAIGRRSGCFLPQVARDTGWGRTQLLDRLCMEKMGLPAAAWRGPDARLSVFTVLTIGPEPFVPSAV